MMPSASAPTSPKSTMGPQLRPWLTLTGVIGLRGPLPPAPGRAPFAALALAAPPALAPLAAGPALALPPVLALAPVLAPPPVLALAPVLAAPPVFAADPVLAAPVFFAAPPTGESLGFPPGFVLDGRFG